MSPDEVQRFARIEADNASCGIAYEDGVWLLRLAAGLSLQLDAHREEAARAGRLRQALSGLMRLVETVREEQVSAGMGFGRTPAEKRERAAVYAGRIASAAAKIDDALDGAREALEPAEGGHS